MERIKAEKARQETFREIQLEESQRAILEETRQTAENLRQQTEKMRESGEQLRYAQMRNLGKSEEYLRKAEERARQAEIRACETELDIRKSLDAYNEAMARHLKAAAGITEIASQLLGAMERLVQRATAEIATLRSEKK